MATYVNDLRLKEIATGDESGTWGTSTNTNLELIAEAFSFGTEAITTNADTHTTTIADGSTDPGRSIYLKYTGTLDSACTITIGPNTVSKLWFIENGTSGSQNIIISQGSGANVTIPAGHVKAVYSDGAGSGAAMVDAFTDLNLAGTTTVDVLSGSGNATIGGTLGVTGAVTANAGVSIDNITIDGTEIDLSSGDLSIDVAGNLQIDADDNGEVRFLDGGTQFATIKKDGNNALFQSIVADGDFVIQGIDGSSVVSALTLDMSDAGTATFNNNVNVGGIGHVSLSGAASEVSVGVSGDTDNSGGGVSFAHNTSTLNSYVLGQKQSMTVGSAIATPLIFVTNNTERMRIDSSGNVGIGTTSPSAELDVFASSTPAVRVADSSGFNVRLEAFGSNAAGLVCAGGSTNMTFQTDETERMRIDSSGRLLVASSTAVTGITTAKLQINGTDNSGSTISIGRFSANANAPVLNFIKSRNGTVGGNTIVQDGDNLGSILFGGNDGTDNVSIAAKIFGEVDGTPGSNDMPGRLTFFTTADGASTPTERMRITSTGRTFIGTSSALSSDNGGGLDVFATGGGPHVMNLKNSDTSGGANMIRFIDGGGDTCGEINSNATSNTTSYGTSSDGRYKDVIGEARGLEIINSLNPVKFTWKSSGEEDEGLIAQEVLEIVPNAITGSEETKYMMDYSKLVTPLVKAIQEQQEQIEALQSEINILKGE